MEMSGIYQQSLYSLKQSLGVATLRKAMNQDALTVTTLLSDMQSTTSKVMEQSITPHKGGNVDVRI